MNREQIMKRINALANEGRSDVELTEIVERRKKRREERRRRRRTPKTRPPLLASVAALCIMLVVLVCGMQVVPASADPQRFQEILKMSGFSDADIVSMKSDGKLLTKVMSSSNEREVAMGFACLIKTLPGGVDGLRDIFLSNRLKKKVDPDLTEFGTRVRKGIVERLCKAASGAER